MRNLKIPTDSREDYYWEIVEEPQTEHQANTVVNISLEFVGKEMVYDSLKWNCEHFARFCFEAKIHSDQVLIGKSVTGGSIFGTTIAATSSAANAAIVASTPAATVLGSEYVGSLAVYYGVMAAPTAPAWVPVAAGAAAVTACAAVGAACVKWINQKETVPLIEENVKEECNLCFEYNVCVRFLPCHHMIACHNCSKEVDTCPQCQSQIEKKVQIFESVRLNS